MSGPPRPARARSLRRLAAGCDARSDRLASRLSVGGMNRPGGNPVRASGHDALGIHVAGRIRPAQHVTGQPQRAARLAIAPSGPAPLQQVGQCLRLRPGGLSARSSITPTMASLDALNISIPTLWPPGRGQRHTLDGHGPAWQAAGRIVRDGARFDCGIASALVVGFGSGLVADRRRGLRQAGAQRVVA